MALVNHTNSQFFFLLQGRVERLKCENEQLQSGTIQVILKISTRVLKCKIQERKSLNLRGQLFKGSLNSYALVQALPNARSRV